MLTILRDGRQGVHTSVLLLRKWLIISTRELDPCSHSQLTFLASSPASGSRALASAGISSGLFEVDWPPGAESGKSLGVLSTAQRISINLRYASIVVTYCLRFQSLCAQEKRFERGGVDGEVRWNDTCSGIERIALQRSYENPCPCSVTRRGAGRVWFKTEGMRRPTLDRFHE